MTIRDAATLKTYFQTGKKPTEQQFADLVDSALARGPYEYDASAAVVSADDSIALKTAGVNRVTVDASGNASFFGSFQLNSGNRIMKWLEGTVNVNFGSTSPASSSSATFTVSGAATGDHVYVASELDSESLFLGNAIVTAPNTVKVRLFSTSSAVDPAAIDIHYKIQK